MTALADTFTGSPDGVMNARVATSGHTWHDLNGNGVVKGGLYIRDPAQPAGGATGGVYCETSLDQAVTSMTGVVSWTGPTPTIGNQATGFALIFSNADTHGGTTPNEQIFQNCAHAAIHNWGIDVTTYTGGVASADILSYLYPGGTMATDGRSYSIGIELRGQIMSVLCPDGTTQKCASPLFTAYRGPFVIFQCFDTPYPPTYDGSGNVTAGLQPAFKSLAATTDPLAGYVPPWPLPQTLGVETEPR